jgi:PAS domain S-box-containing protein
MLGHHPEDLLAMNMVDLTHPEDKSEVGQIMAKIIQNREDTFDFQQRLVTADNNSIWVNFSGALIWNENGQIEFGIGISENVTEQRNAQQALEESIETFRGFMSQSTDGIMLSDDEGRITEWSTGMENNTGIPAEEAIGQYVWEVQYQLAPHEHKSRVSSDQLKSLYETFIQDVIDGSKHQMTETKIEKPGGEQRSIQIVTFPIQTDNGMLVGGIHRDITEQKRAQQSLQDLMTDLDRSNKELEQFAYIASHDLQEPLRKIQTFGDRLKAKYLDVLDERGQDFLSRMGDAADRGQKMVEALLLYSRVTTQGKPFIKTDLNQILDNVLSDLEVQIKNQKGQIEVGVLPTLEADPSQMQQLFQNLISNAMKFHQLDQPPEVKVYCTNGEDNLVQINVTDQGIGFDESYSDQIFQPFQRLHGRSEFEGNGIGLSICRKITERHGGEITVQSQPGQGSTFTVHLPLKTNLGPQQE